MTKPQSPFSLVDLLWLVLLFAIGAAFWTHSQYQSWAFLTFAIYFGPLVYLNMRLHKPIFPTVFALLPICSLMLFAIAISASLRHPPFMVPADWEWPPFENFSERAGHAFALCVWQIFWAPIAVVFAGTTLAIGNRFGDPCRPTWFAAGSDRQGCLALAANLLRFATKRDSSGGAPRIQEIQGVEQIFNDDDDLQVILLRQAETVDRKPNDQSAGRTRLQDRIALLGCGFVAFLLVSIFMLGLTYLGQLIFGKR